MLPLLILFMQGCSGVDQSGAEFAVPKRAVPSASARQGNHQSLSNTKKSIHSDYLSPRLHRYSQ
jgi:hypothetical protein